jgi:hypothetical protein
MITIHNLHKEKPSEPYDFKVDRTTLLGNPYVMPTENERELVCNLYEKNFDKIIKPEWLSHLITIYEEYSKLRLFCWCSPKRCHAETIKKYIEAEAQKEGM